MCGFVGKSATQLFVIIACVLALGPIINRFTPRADGATARIRAPEIGLFRYALIRPVADPELRHKTRSMSDR
jgi:hypothetical protein